MNSPDDDRALIARFVDGDQQAFDTLMRRHDDRVFGICLRIMTNRENALDAAQETFITLYRKAHLYDERAAFTTWLYRVTVNTCYDQLRKLKRRATSAMGDEYEPEDVAAGDPFIAVELRPDLKGALDALSPEFRAAVVLADVEGISLPDVSEILGVPVGTVKSRLFRARRIMARTLGNRAGPTDHPRTRVE